MAMLDILLAAYNGERFLREQLDSLLAQSWTDWRLSASDDGSTDGTAAILDEYAALHPGRITRLHHGGRFGSARDHFFWLMAQCKSPYVMFCDQDDVWQSDKVEKTMALLLRAEAAYGADTPVLVFTDLTPVDESLRPLAPSLMKMQKQDASHLDYRAILFQNIVTGCATGVNRAMVRLAGQCPNPSQVIMHDWWLALVAARFGKMVYLGESTMLYRQHGGNSVGAKEVGGGAYVRHALINLRGIAKSISQKKRQAAAFQQAYGQHLNDEELAFLSGFVKNHSGFFFYGKYNGLIHGFYRKIGFLILG